MPAKKFTKKLAIFVVKELIIKPISLENCSEANKAGKIFCRGPTKSICWVAWKTLRDWSIRIGVKNQIGRKIIISKNTIISETEKFLEFVFLTKKS